VATCARRGRGETNTYENKRPNALVIEIAPGISQEVKRHDPLDEILPADQFLALLDRDATEKISAELEKLYSDTRKCDYPVLPQFLSVVYMKLCKIKKLSVLYRKLRTDDCRLAESLGFRKNGGKVEVPSYQNLWVFLKKRLTEQKIDELSQFILARLNGELSLRGREFGKNVAHDGIVVRAYDDEAKYNDHYKTTMYKGEVGFDLDNFVPICGEAAPSTDYDGRYVKGFMERLDAVEKKRRTVYLDGHYASIENYARLNHVHNARSVINIPGDQRIISDAGKEENIDKWYQRLHGREDFAIGATIDDKLSLLLKYGRVGEVGYYYRNKYVAEYLKDPGAYLKEYHNRSLEETANNLMKNGLVDIENASNGTGIANRNLHIKLCVLTMQLVALIRAHRGRVEKLTSVENLAC